MTAKKSATKRPIIRAVGYVRVSTDEQARSGLGLADQREKITREANHRGWDLEIIEDNGSGKDLDRPGIRKALARLAAGDADALVVAKLDRLSRSIFDFADLVRRATREGWSVAALDIGVDTSTINGKLLANMMMVLAEWERDLIGERTQDAMRAARTLPGFAGYGRPILTPDAVAGRIAALRASGESFRAIAATLNDENIPTAHGGSQWWPSTVRDILQRVTDGEVA